MTFDVEDIAFGVIASYRPPSINKNLYISELAEVLSQIKFQKQRVELFLGDININLLERDDSTALTSLNDYLGLLSGFGFSSYINKPTTDIESQKPSILDHAFVRTGRGDIGVKPAVIELNLTDHNMLFLSFLSFSFKERKGEQYKLNIQTMINYEKLNRTLAGKNWQEIFAEQDPQVGYEQFLSKFKMYVERHSRLNVITSRNRKLKPWITRGLINSIRHRDFLKKRLKNNSDSEKVDTLD
ncbi:uncharacterized protein LOC123322362 [Coccinella septempunctata]|uniref:uncharacterized protein LOC123322362 n=1 Tax=Coccinella septempunctata TaxID=41139 RepID=UPI001D06538E|nr:uncharacterized protein LOC123322362 [Coccinella septempunctata]